MSFTHEEFLRARRISRAIQEYLEEIGEEGLRSTDIYPILARKGLIEKDRHSGLHFRKFLRKLKENNLLHLIPQCQCRATSGETCEWYFYRSMEDTSTSAQVGSSRKSVMPKISENEINELISEITSQIEMLPKRETSSLTPQMLGTRHNYPRAYEIWTKEEIEILINTYRKFERIDKVAELLKRQPSAVKMRLIELKIIK